MKKHIELAQASFILNFENNVHSKWLVLKYEIRNFPGGYSEEKAKLRHKTTFPYTVQGKGFQ